MPMPAHMTATGQNQGAIDGSCTQQGRENTILIQGLEHNVTIPRDIQTGLPTGKRQHNPLTVTKVYDKSSPKFCQALCTGEQFTEVVIKFYRIDPTGQEEHYYTIKLENAIVVNMRPWVPNCLDPQTESFTHMEDISFTYRKIIWTWVPDGIEAEDDWEVPR